MAKELSTIITNAAEVRDAEETAENTAERVGSVLCDVLDYLAGQLRADGVELTITESQARIVFNFHNSSGQGVASQLIIGEASTTKAGLLTPTLLTKLNTAYSQSAANKANISTNKTDIATNKTDIATRKAEILELEKRLLGTSAQSNAFSDPFLFLGDKKSMDEVNETLDAIVAEVADPETKYTGRLLISSNGKRFNVFQFALYFETGNFIQRVEGPCGISADGYKLTSTNKYNIVYRRISDFKPEIWRDIPDLVPEATEEHSGLLMDTEKWFLNCFRNYGEVSSSAVAENEAKRPSFFETKRPLIMFYYETNKKQCGLLISLPAGENIHGQTLLLGSNIYRRTVTVSGTTSTATAWTAV